MAVKNKELLEKGLQGASTATILRVTEKLVGLIAEVTTIIAANTQVDPKEETSRYVLDQQNDDFSEKKTLSQDPAQGKSSKPKSNTAATGLEFEKLFSSANKGNDPNDYPFANVDELKSLLPDDEVILQEIAKELNDKIQEFEQEARTLFKESKDLPSELNPDKPIEREHILQFLKGLVGQLQATVQGIKGVNVGFVDFLSQLLKEPETIHNRSKAKESNKFRKRSPSPPVESDGPSQSKFNNFMKKVKGIFIKGEHEERTHT